MTRGWLMLLGLAALWPGPAAAAGFLPPPSQVVTPAEAPLLQRLMTIQKQADGGDRAGSLAAVDGLLAQVPSPTPFRGLLQMTRAMLLDDMQRGDEAVGAITESIRLLPESSGPLLTGFRIFTYRGKESEAVDLLLRAAAMDPASTNRFVRDYDLRAITIRLDGRKDLAKAQALSDRLLAIGWQGDRMASRAGLAQTAMDLRVTEGRYAEARKLIPEITLPGMLYGMLADKRYAPLWPDLEAWGGPRLSRSWPVYLREAKARWEASHDPERAEEYVKALGSADRDAELAATFASVFLAPLDADKDVPLMFALPTVGHSLGELGRWDEARRIYANFEKTWSLDTTVNALNITANETNFLLRQGQPAAALAMADRSIAAAETAGPEVNASAVQTMHGTRVCALAALGRPHEAAVSLGILAGSQNPETVAHSYLCLNDLAGARAALIAGLRDDNRRGAALSAVQPRGPSRAATAYDRTMRARWDALRSDRAVLAEVAKVGRVLPYALSEGAAAADPVPAAPVRAEATGPTS